MAMVSIGIKKKKKKKSSGGLELINLQAIYRRRYHLPPCGIKRLLDFA